MKAMKIEIVLDQEQNPLEEWLGQYEGNPIVDRARRFVEARILLTPREFTFYTPWTAVILLQLL
jgi:hypothetical protein